MEPGFFDRLFGWSYRAEVNAQKDIELKEIQESSEREKQELLNQANEKVRLAELELERIKNQRYESEYQRDLEVERIRKSVEEYKALINSITSQQVALITTQSEQQAEFLRGQTQIGLASITESARTERWKIGWGWLCLLVIIGIGGYLLSRETKPD